MANRKPWDRLSRDRRVRLQRWGIDKSAYESGAPINERQRRNKDTQRLYGLSPEELTRLRRENPDLAQQAERIARLRKSNPSKARDEGRKLWQSLSTEQREQRFTVRFESTDREYTNPLTWYH